VTDPYTRVPNLVYDIVGPLLSSPERDCLFYIVRRTWGFPDANGAPKARDTIALEQFENGISSGDRLLDLGTQLSRNTIRKALRGLEAKELVEVRYACTHCFWEQARGKEMPEKTGKRGYSCPRCRASLTRAWALANLTPRKLCDLLNEHDKQGRIFTWDAEERRFHFQTQDDSERKKTQEDVKAEIKRLQDMVWYPELVQQAIDMAGSKNKKISLGRQLNNFWKPVYELQEEYPKPSIIRHALEQTIKAGIPGQPKNYRWYRYMQAVAKNYSGPVSSSQDPANSPELETRALLRRAAELNGSGQEEQARALLSDILSRVDSLKNVFNGDEILCERSLREAFKQGTSDFVGIRPNPYGLDFYPEWSWGE
jgi:hypothetical protein